MITINQCTVFLLGTFVLFLAYVLTPYEPSTSNLKSTPNERKEPTKDEDSKANIWNFPKNSLLEDKDEAWKKSMLLLQAETNVYVKKMYSMMQQKLKEEYRPVRDDYNTKNYRTIKVFPHRKGTDSSFNEDCNGDQTACDNTNWAFEKLAENVPAPEIIEIVDHKSIKEACEEHFMCIVAVLPHILDCQADCRNGYLKMLTAMGEKYKKNMWGWAWSEAGSQPELENMLEMKDFGYPAMAVLSVKKMKYSNLRGSFSSGGINEFLRDFSFGRGPTAAIKNVPSSIKIFDLEPWDGKDEELQQDDLPDMEPDEL